MIYKILSLTLLKFRPAISNAKPIFLRSLDQLLSDIKLKLHIGQVTLSQFRSNYIGYQSLISSSIDELQCI